MAREFLLYFALKYEGDTSKICDAIERKERYSQKEYNEVIQNKRFNYIDCFDSRYPHYLRQEDNFPVVLFYEGNLDLLNVEDLEIKNLVSEDNKRALATCIPHYENDAFMIDYLIMAADQRDLDILIGRIKEAEIPLKDYSKPKDKQLIH